MAGALGSVGAVLPRCSFLLNPSRTLMRPTKPSLAAAIRASPSPTTATATIGANAELALEAKVESRRNKLACPICYYPLITKNDQNSASTYGYTLECNSCKKAYLNNETYIDLTVAGGSEDYSETMPAATELFRTPLVSYLYERGWRQNFVWGGFPGPEKEFEMAKDYLKPTIGGTIVDASCGSGLFSRLFAKSGMYSLVIALDFSENMLRQCNEFIKQENISKENLILVRADISRLPFSSSSIDAVHAGAAIHCWPSPSTAVAEISRVLRPGGVFVATTFILDILPSTIPVLKTVRQYFAQATSNTIYLSEGELGDLCRACGLVNFTCVRSGPFVMLSASKPR
ncbi:uncharacterized methyltransferase At1g78140, chloroplastic [Ananas comosus]|uniref:Putative methyltransferase, chloroplastic n=1 Tax=Ananas comosus TaxID=4615 RepID=A0A199V0T8_ANACO|nr:uncharacterized methyltransferase At1g78140, chloroplastic [Ananas comosus]OAY70659.1 putative methyltransferase, chloroplastic [Ananas comosus]